MESAFRWATFFVYGILICVISCKMCLLNNAHGHVVGSRFQTYINKYITSVRCCTQCKFHVMRLRDILSSPGEQPWAWIYIYCRWRWFCIHEYLMFYHTRIRLATLNIHSMRPHIYADWLSSHPFVARLLDLGPGRSSSLSENILYYICISDWSCSCRGLITILPIISLIIP